MTGPSWQDLNAYVDGELPPDAAAEVAGAIAADRELAGRVAALAQLKATTGSALAVDPDEAPQLRLPRPGGRPSITARWRWPASAAAVVLVAVLGIAGWSELAGRNAGETWLAAAESRHLVWLADEPHAVPIDDRAIALAAAPDAPSRVPDLGFARLTVAHLAVDPSGRQPGLYVGYVGINGCRLGLWIAPAAAGLAADLAEHREAGLHSFTWRVGGTGYAVMARNMDDRRLAAIARHLEQLTRSGPETRLAGREGAAADAPCLA